MDRPPHTFSKRTAWNLGAGDHATAVAAARAWRSDLIDLTVSNPTVCNFDYDADAILGPLADREAMAQALVYDPAPLGMRSAREAVAAYYAEHGAEMDPDAVVLTTSTSEAYSYLFRLLCDSGDAVLVAQPSYPLFDFLADIDDVQLNPYPLFYDFGWWIDFAELERRITPTTRAILVVHPNNPTGHWTHRAERERLETLCLERGLALIVDEVFLDYPLSDYPLSGPPARSFAAGPHAALTFVLSGLSKVAALPQMKVAWLATFGPEQARIEALSRLEVIADTFLSMNAPAQLALPAWLAVRQHLQHQISERTRTNLAALQASGLDVLVVEAGWSAVAQFRASRMETGKTAAEELLDRFGLIVHPGSFYGLADARTIVISLLPPEDSVRVATKRLALPAGHLNQAS